MTGPLCPHTRWTSLRIYTGQRETGAPLGPQWGCLRPCTQRGAGAESLRMSHSRQYQVGNGCNVFTVEKSKHGAIFTAEIHMEGE